MCKLCRGKGSYFFGLYRGIENSHSLPIVQANNRVTVAYTRFYNNIIGFKDQKSFGTSVTLSGFLNDENIYRGTGNIALNDNEEYIGVFLDSCRAYNISNDTITGECINIYASDQLQKTGIALQDCSASPYGTVANNIITMSGKLTVDCISLKYIGLASYGDNLVKLLCNRFAVHPPIDLLNPTLGCEAAQFIDIYIGNPITYVPGIQHQGLNLIDIYDGNTINNPFGNSYTIVSPLANEGHKFTFRHVFVAEFSGGGTHYNNLIIAHHEYSTTDNPPSVFESSPTNDPVVDVNTFLIGAAKICPDYTCYYRGTQPCGTIIEDGEGNGGGFPGQGGSPPAPEENNGTGEVFPNPTTGMVNFNLQNMYPDKPYDEVLTGTLQLYNNNLEQVYSSTFSTASLLQRELSGLAGGTYIYHISTSRGIKTGTIILVR